MKAVVILNDFILLGNEKHLNTFAMLRWGAGAETNYDKLCVTYVVG